ncbi:unnamed protein product [Hyaloperonospora brassicae]|uniref:Kinetochore protein SPC25 n=1 Tax=Hyaloperonospora brassicae TaxID=162125 RepID=A0AAV0TIL2_HYABA|nr:unnamed protein product [Hyaloperonospora brassicae]
MQEVWRSVEPPAPLETNSLVQQNLEHADGAGGVGGGAEDASLGGEARRPTAGAGARAGDGRGAAQARDAADRAPETVNGVPHEGEGGDCESSGDRGAAGREEQEGAGGETFAGQDGLAMYQKPGLVFEHSEVNRIVIRFTQIDAQDPSREFSFRITINPITDRYIVDNCNEEVAALDELVTNLNESGDLARFVRSMRRQFKQLV